MNFAGMCSISLLQLCYSNGIDKQIWCISTDHSLLYPIYRKVISTLANVSFITLDNTILYNIIMNTNSTFYLLPTPTVLSLWRRTSLAPSCYLLYNTGLHTLPLCHRTRLMITLKNLYKPMNTINRFSPSLKLEGMAICPSVASLMTVAGSK